MRSGMIALAISATVVTAYHALQQQPPPGLGITPELFDWRPSWLSQVVGFVASTLVLALVIGMVIKFARWLAGLRDWS
jgi:hypothetical protein